MRILALVTDAFGGYGGIAQYNRDLLSALSRSGCVEEIVVVPRFAHRDMEALPAKVRQVPPRASRMSYVAKSLSEAQRAGPFDVVFSGHLFHTPLAALIGRAMNVPVWLQTHGIDAWDCPAPLVRASAERASLITTVSRHTKQRLLSWANVAPERVRVLPNTFRPIFSPGPADTRLLQQHGLDGRKIILTVARLAKADHYKGHGKIMEALPAVLAHHADAVYVVVGEGDARQGIEDEVNRRGLGQHVRFLGRLSDAHVLDLYRSAQVFAMPSSKEGFGIVFVEAAATGLPVIGGNRDGSRDALADGAIGTMIDPDDTDALAASILAALARPKRSDVAAVQRFAFDKFAHHVGQLAQSLAS
ncbi:MAG: glycosyltransferase family 1 protein [Hyphomicrobiales bacterium]|nr:MAG: glycosyltransferase family 1 protein [Hyphomicrobiales bacterium]